MYHPSEGSSELLLLQASFFFFLKEAIPKKHSKGGQKWEHTSFFIKRSMCFIYFSQASF